MVEYPYLPTVGRNTAAMVVETAWLIKRAMLIPLERIRVGINSESASHTHTPGPIAKNAMKMKRLIATSQPLGAVGTGVIRASSILSGALREAQKSLNGFEKNATTLLAARQLSPLVPNCFPARSPERATLRPAREASHTQI